jgi:vacuole morphology and inheritance protein 14
MEGEATLPSAVLRGLGDRMYDKRKAATIEIQSIVKACYEKGDYTRINSIITLLAQEFSRSRNVNHRKGGVNGLAGIAVGLTGMRIEQFLELLVPPVLECFDDPESRVCYYAAESLYNIAKVARTHVLKYFNPIFDGLCKLFAHVDNDVKNAAALLDRLIKDIVTQSDSFDLESFIPLLQKHIKRTKPYIRQLLVSWICVLDTVPDLNMLDYLPDFLDGLFNMLSDGNREIKQMADNALSDFLKEINDADVVELGPIIPILMEQSRSKERTNRLVAMTWLNDFIDIGKTALLKFYAVMLGSIMFCTSDPDKEINSLTKKANLSLMSLIQSTSIKFDLDPLLQTLTRELVSEFVTTRLAALHWVSMLHEKDPEEMNKSIGNLLPVLLKTVSDEDDEAVLLDLQVIARISQNEDQFLRVLNALVQLFMEDRSLLETRGSLVVRKLCSFMEGKKIYVALASILDNTFAGKDLEFVSLMVQTLNLILLTAPELGILRKLLKDSFDGDDAMDATNSKRSNSKEENRELFYSLFRCWSHNPVATFSLCLLAQAYELSSALILKFSEVDVTVGFLMQIDKLIQLLESPVFIHLRLQLLEMNPKHAALLKSLYGLLMLLPQSQAYRILAARLNSLSSLQQHMQSVVLAEKDPGREIRTMEKILNQEEYKELFVRFGTVQERHLQHRLKLLEATIGAKQLKQKTTQSDNKNDNTNNSSNETD